MHAFSALTLIAELGVALAGFGGVAIAVGGHARKYAPTERLRILTFFSLAALCVAASLLCIVLLVAGISESTTWRAASIFLTAAEAGLLASLAPRTLRSVRDPEASTGARWAAFSSTVMLAAIGAAAINVFLAMDWLVLAVLCLTLLLSLAVFLRFLLSRN
jgi:hypothetical protein